MVVGYRGDQIDGAPPEALPRLAPALRRERRVGSERTASRCSRPRRDVARATACSRWPITSTRPSSCAACAADDPGARALLGVDHDIERCFDLDDATKVGVERGSIVRIAKELERVRRASTRACSASARRWSTSSAACSSRRGDARLRTACARCAARGVFAAVDVGDARWIDVDTPRRSRAPRRCCACSATTSGDEPGEAPGPDRRRKPSSCSRPRGCAPPSRTTRTTSAAAEREGVARMMSNESPFPPSERVVAGRHRARSAAATSTPAAPDACADKLGAREGSTRAACCSAPARPSSSTS